MDARTWNTARAYVIGGALSGFFPSPASTPEQQAARRKLFAFDGPAALNECQHQVARMCDAEYGPNLTGGAESLLHFDLSTIRNDTNRSRRSVASHTVGTPKKHGDL